MIRFILVQNKQGKARLMKWYAPYDNEEKLKIQAEVHRLVAPRDTRSQSNFVEFRSNKIVYRRYAGLFFCLCVDGNDNELAYLEAIHLFVEVLGGFRFPRAPVPRFAAVPLAKRWLPPVRSVCMRRHY